MAKLMVASFDEGQTWLLHDYGNQRRHNIQPLVFVRGSMFNDQIAPFSLKGYTRHLNKYGDGNIFEVGKYHNIESFATPMVNGAGHKAKTYTAKDIAENFGKAIMERLVLEPNDESMMYWSIMEDIELFYKNEAAIQFFNAKTNEFIVGIDVYLFNPYLEQMPSVVFGRRDVEYRNEDSSTWGSSETYRDEWFEKERLMSDVCAAIYDAIGDQLQARIPPMPVQAVPIPESEWKKMCTPIKPYGLGPNGEILNVTMTSEEEGDLRRGLSISTTFAFVDDDPPEEIDLYVGGQDDVFIQKMCIILAKLGFYSQFNRDKMTVTVSPNEIAPF